MKTILYIHGYNSNGNARKCQQLRSMLAEHQVIAPTLDYDGKTPYAILQELKTIIDQENVDMIVGSSFGGYYTLCCTRFFYGPVWVINPVRDMMGTLELLKPVVSESDARLFNQRKEDYRTFDSEIFQTLQPQKEFLNMALSLDDDLLGDHHPLLHRFPNHNKVVWKDHCGHHFSRFDELKNDIIETLQ